MEKYRRTTIGTDSDVQHPAPTNEIRIATQGKIKTYVSRICDILTTGDQPTAIIIGKGNAVSKAVTVTEIARRRLGGSEVVRQDTDVLEVEAVDVWEPIEDGLDRHGNVPLVFKMWLRVGLTM
ncbi:Ribonuclease P protein subunit p25 [Thoreauomyces humboldtii]|nr:Ribonuclease P protein subunit p25 [Thoreauomyces humboldtii]